jgi:hypothetical protein
VDFERLFRDLGDGNGVQDVRGQVFDPLAAPAHQVVVPLVVSVVAGDGALVMDPAGEAVGWSARRTSALRAARLWTVTGCPASAERRSSSFKPSSTYRALLFTAGMLARMPLNIY